MTSRERMMIALNNGRPDRLPCQVHGWMDYYLKTYLGGMDWWQAYEKFGMDYAIYAGPAYTYAEKDLANWQVRRTDLGQDADGNRRWVETIATPKGTLHHAGTVNEITGWETELLIKNRARLRDLGRVLPRPHRGRLPWRPGRQGPPGRQGHHPLAPVQPRPRQPVAELLHPVRHRREHHGRHGLTRLAAPRAGVHRAKDPAGHRAVAGHPGRHGGDRRRGRLQHGHQPGPVRGVLPAVRPPADTRPSRAVGLKVRLPPLRRR